MSVDPPADGGELRFDPLTGEWVSIVGHRQSRPNLPDDGCPFCPGGLEAPEPYTVRWFENRWPAYSPGPAVDLTAAEAAGVLLSVFQNRRWDADYLTVQDVLARGLVGEPFVIESCVTGYRLTPGYKLPSGDLPRAWRTYAEFGGGPFRDWGAPLLDQAVQLAGDTPLRVHADFQYRRDWDVETAGTALLTYAGPDGRIGDGLRYVVEVGNISAIARPRWYIRGSEGAYLQYGRDAQEAALHRGEVGPRPMDPENAPRLVRDVSGTMQDVPFEGKSGNYLAYYENVAEAIRGGAALAVTGRSVLPSIRIIDAAMRSASTGSVVMPAAARA